MKHIFFIFLFLAGVVPAYSLTLPPPTDWHMGSMVLNSGLELKGELYYDQVTEIVQYKSNTMIKAFSSHQVQSFQLVEQGFGLLREFVSRDFNPRSHYHRKTFFEVVLKGPLPLLRRHYNLHEMVNIPTEQQADGQPESFDHATGFAYYVQVDNQLVDLKKFRKQVFPILTTDFDQEINQLMKEKNLRLFVLDHQIRLINYYNFLKSQRINHSIDSQDVAVMP